MGSITEIVDNAGNVKQKYQYSAFGRIQSVKDQNNTEVGIASSPFKNSFTFTGREWDNESGLYYYRARNYDANNGRFLQQDPHPGFLASPISHINKYIYGANNPNVFTDPSGMSWISEFDDHNGRWATDALIAIATIALIYFSGGTAVSFLDAAAAVGSVAGGVSITAAMMSAGEDGDFFNNFEGHFHSMFRVSMAILSLEVIGADILGGGLDAAGGNGVNGYVQSHSTIVERGGITLGHVSFIDGAQPLSSVSVGGNITSLIAHEAGHTVQFMMIGYATAAFRKQLGGDQNANTWGIFLGLGLTGIFWNDGPFESMASRSGWAF